jgi:hypothetical protein
MNERDLTEKMRAKFVGELSSRKRKTVEEALQEALDNTTPEHSGSPNYDKFETDEHEESEWI